MSAVWISPSLYATDCKWSYLNLRRPSTPAMEWGTLAHELIIPNIFKEKLDSPKIKLLPDDKKKRLAKNFHHARKILAPLLEDSTTYLEGTKREKMIPGEWKKPYETLLCHIMFEKFGIRFSPDIVSFLLKKIHIIDLKTGKSKANVEQLEAMALAFHKMFGHEVITGSFFYLETGEMVTYEISNFEMLEKRFESLAVKIIDRTKAPRKKHRWCFRCNVKSECAAYGPVGDKFAETENATIYNILGPRSFV